MVKFNYQYHPLKFITPGGTSRGVLKEKPSWIIKLTDENNTSGYGEISIIEGLSVENISFVDNRLKQISERINGGKLIVDLLDDFPAGKFAFEQAYLDLKKGNRTLFENDFSLGKKGIVINGLVWMNPLEKMLSEAKQKISNGFTCLKFKIGALNWNDELNLIRSIRNEFGDDIEIRVDANGAFNESNVFQVMDELQELQIHSIEQPIKVREWELMNKVCQHNDVGVALDEELIGINENQNELLQAIHPNYLILKPSLLGGFDSSDNWIQLAEEKNIGWWATSALESNIGLNAIAQWVASKEINLPQGLGTGSLFANNIDSPLSIKKDKLYYDSNLNWKLPF